MNKHIKEELNPVELEEALAILRSRINKITETETVGLRKAYERTLAEDILAKRDQPPFSRSPLDGYAVRAEDTKGASKESPVTLRVIAEVDAGSCFGGTVQKGEAVRIMTGAPAPDGADAIIGQEDTDYGEELVSVYCEMRPRQNWIFKGEEYREGDVLLACGAHIGPSEVGVIAGAGSDCVKVYRRPKAIIMSTGDEVVMPGEELKEGQIYNSNLFTTEAQLCEWGVDVTEVFHVPDDPEEAGGIIDSHIEDVDMVISTGGVSVGKKDIMHAVYDRLGIERLFWRIKMKPGMAMMAGMYKGKPVLSISGNPYAAFADMQMVVREAIGMMSGSDHLKMASAKAVLTEGYSKKSPSRRFIRTYVEDGKAFIEGHTGGNSDITSGRGINALIDVPAGSDALNEGDEVTVLFV